MYQLGQCYAHAPVCFPVRRSNGSAQMHRPQSAAACSRNLSRSTVDLRSASSSKWDSSAFCSHSRCILRLQIRHALLLPQLLFLGHERVPVDHSYARGLRSSSVIRRLLDMIARECLFYTECKCVDSINNLMN